MNKNINFLKIFSRTSVGEFPNYALNCSFVLVRYKQINRQMVNCVFLIKKVDNHIAYYTLKCEKTYTPWYNAVLRGFQEDDCFQQLSLNIKSMPCVFKVSLGIINQWSLYCRTFTSFILYTPSLSLKLV